MSTRDVEREQVFSALTGVAVGVACAAGLALAAFLIVSSQAPGANLAFETGFRLLAILFATGLAGFFDLFTPTRVVLLVAALVAILIFMENASGSDLARGLPIALVVIGANFLGDRAYRWRWGMPKIGDDDRGPNINETWNYLRMIGEGWWLVPEKLKLIFDPRFNYQNLNVDEKRKIVAAADAQNRDIGWLTSTKAYDKRLADGNRERLELEGNRVLFTLMRDTIFRKASVLDYLVILLTAVAGGFIVGAGSGFALFTGDEPLLMLDQNRPPVENLAETIKAVGTLLLVPGSMLLAASPGRIAAAIYAETRPVRWSVIWPTYIIGLVAYVIAAAWVSPDVRAFLERLVA